MNRLNYPTTEDCARLINRPTIDLEHLKQQVESVLQDVKVNGDIAVKRYTEKFDKVSLNNFTVNQQEIEEAIHLVPDSLKTAIQHAKTNIEKFHTSQIESPKKIETTKGVICWRKSIGIEKVGLYIPGGSAPLFSTILMLAVPAKIAECKEIILCTPPNSESKVNAAILYTAWLCGITNIYKLGGAQAIAAMAYGTETIPAVYKIFGPGNQYVTCAKQIVAQKGTAIDMPAGPSELAVLVDDSCNPAFVAADLLSQAEHGPDSQVILVATNERLILKVEEEIKLQLKTLTRKSIAEEALLNSFSILVRTIDEGINILNQYAPEHLIIACKNPENVSEKISNAGSIFLGNYSCESAGDYASGTNHTLPTSGYAKMYSGVSLDSFVKKITFQKINEEGIINLGKTIEKMAEAEGLGAHKNAVTLRLQQLNNA